MSDTPRTDKAFAYYRDGQHLVEADFARQLERENASLRRERDTLSAEVDQWAARCASAIWMLPETVTGGQLRDAQNKWFLQMDTLKRENAVLRETLMKCRFYVTNWEAYDDDSAYKRLEMLRKMDAFIDAARKEQP